MALRYNNIEFTYCQTELNVAGAEMDPSGSDQLYTVIKLRCRAVLNASLYPNLGYADPSPAAVLATVRHLLTAPRKPLYYDLNSPPLPAPRVGPPVLNIPDGRDDANGPVPDPDAFSAVYTTPSTIEVTWAVTVKLVDCGNSGRMPLSFRWQTEIDFDKYWKATYRQSGWVIFSSQSQVTPDTFRRTNLAPVVMPGFARERAHYQVSADGLRCDFEFIDVQTRITPPYPCVDMDIIQSESFPLAGGMRLGELTVFVKGMLNANPVDLEFWCMVVAWSRFYAADPLGDRKTNRMLGQAVFSTHETRDSVDATFTISYKVDPQGGGGSVESRTGNSRVLTSVGQFFYGVELGNFIYEQVNGPVGGGGSVGIPTGSQTGVAGKVNTVTEQGRITAANQPFPWVGRGTMPISPLNPEGYKNWASPAGSISGPEGGFPLANAVVLYAAILRDPCGGAVRAMPNATQITTTVDMRNPGTWNTPAGGRGGATPTTGAQLTAVLSQLTASQMQTTPIVPRMDSPYNSDPRPGNYDLWQCSSEYIKNPGVIVVPTADTGGASKKIRYASTQYTLRLKWVAKRTGSWPMLPLEQTTDPNWVFTGSTTPIREMRISPDSGSYVYEAAGVYEFMALDPSLVKLTTAIPPILSTTAMRQVANWVEAALAGVTTAQAKDLIAVGTVAGNVGTSVLTGGGGSPLGGGSFPGPPP